MSSRGGSGYWCKTRILYALDPADYYTEMIKDYMGKWNKYKREIAEIFVHRMEVDLHIIQNKWKHKKYGKGKDPSLRAAIEKAAGSKKKSGYFMCKMLDASTNRAVESGSFAEINSVRSKAMSMMQ